MKLYMQRNIEEEKNKMENGKIESNKQKQKQKKRIETITKVQTAEAGGGVYSTPLYISIESEGREKPKST